MKHKDVAWPPLGVQDLESDISATKGVVRFPVLRQALEKRKKEGPCR